jgi:methanogenic corrinoid protein MtbC1
MDHVSTSRRSERLERTIQNELVPRLLQSHRAGPLSPSLASAVSRHLPPEDVRAFVNALRNPDDVVGAHFVDSRLQDGCTIETVFLDLLAPAARRLGEMWESDEVDFVEVTMAMGRMQRLLRSLSPAFLGDAERNEPVGSVLLSCMSGEQHTFGLIMVGEFLIRDGWQVLVGAPWSEADLASIVATQWYDVIGFSVGTDNRLPKLRNDIRRLRAASRNPNVQVMVGGQPIAKNPNLARELGADAYAADTRSVPRVARALLAAARASAPADLSSVEGSADRGQLHQDLRRE